MKITTSNPDIVVELSDDEKTLWFRNYNADAIFEDEKSGNIFLIVQGKLVKLIIEKEERVKG